MLKSNTIKGILIGALLTIIVVLFLSKGFGGLFDFSSTPTIDKKILVESISEVSELTTAELSYNGVIRYEEGRIPLITKKAFFMTYHADVRAGVDASKIKMDISDTKVIVTIPKVDIQDIRIDEESIVFYDEKSSLFNWSERQDVLDAIKIAKEDVIEKGDMLALVNKSREKTELIFRNILKGQIEDRELEIEFK